MNTPSPRVLVTGANGFVGRALCKRLRLDGLQVRQCCRTIPPDIENNSQWIATGDLIDTIDWHAALAGCDVVVHLANRAHVLNDSSRNSMQEFRRINVEGSRQLAVAALSAGIKRFVYVSSIGVHGVYSKERITETSPLRPYDSYTRSKLEAEQALRHLAAGATMELVVIRPSLVYGPGCPGNLRRLMQLIAKGIPLPFSDVRNRRSFIALEDLTELLVRCVTNPAAANETFVAAHPVALSTTEAIHFLAQGMRAKVRLFPAPALILDVLAKFVPSLSRLTGSLEIDAGHAEKILSWKARVDAEAGLAAVGIAYVAESEGRLRH